MRAAITTLAVLVVLGALATLMLFGALWPILYMLAAIPGIILLLAMRALPLRLVYVRSFLQAAICALFFAPYVSDFDGIPILQPIYVAFFDYSFEMQTKYPELIASAVVVFVFSLWWTIRRSNLLLNRTRDEKGLKVDAPQGRAG